MLAMLVAICCAAPGKGAPAALEPGVVPREWLVLAPVDARGRRPFAPNAPFLKYLLEPASAPPKEGEVLSGELGREQTWKKRSAADSGSVGGDPVQIAYAEVAWPEDGVALADLDGASVVWVNGVPQVGDSYGYGFGGLPVPMRKGANAIYVTGIRGAFRLELTLPRSELIVNAFDATKGDLVAGVPEDSYAAVVVVNASERRWTTLEVGCGAEEHEEPFEPSTMDFRPLGPRSLLKCPLVATPRPKHVAFATPGNVGLPVTAFTRALDATSSKEIESAVASTLSLEIRADHLVRRATYASYVDLSVQQFALLPPSLGEADALVLTLHGAGVDCFGQAEAYSQKPDFWIVAPTNRRPYGFDWQDWGRRDAYDVLHVAQEIADVDRRRIYLTGHSMGGHGTWHFAANDPATFAAIAPSAGWSGFDSYGGGRPAGALAELWRAADGTSSTLALVDNLKQVPTYVLHGTADDNVTLREAQLMLDALANAGAKPQHCFKEGAGHWWDGDEAAGADCVDWPELFDFFRAHTGKEPGADVDFTTLDPSVASGCRWIRILQPIRYGEPSHVEGRFDAATETATITTRNVRRLQLTSPQDDRSVRAVVDGDAIDVVGGHVSSDAMLTLVRGRWVNAGTETFEAEKSPDRSGPFKRAFDQSFVLVHGTLGNPDEDRELYERARYDAAVWWYRANGFVEVVTDEVFRSDRRNRRYDARSNVILYGNRDTNSAWTLVVDDACPIDATRGALRCGAQVWKSDALGAVFVRPRKQRSSQLVGVIADTGIRGTRLGYSLAYFISGVGYPDYAIYSADVLTKGDGGVLAAGWFDHDWSLPEKK